MELLYADSGNSLGWRLEYWMDKKSFENAILEEQNYVIVGAVASLLVIVQVSVFLAWSLTKPIRSMGAACKKLDENKDGFREYSFPETARKDEIGQLARTFEENGVYKPDVIGAGPRDQESAGRDPFRDPGPGRTGGEGE